MYPRVKLRQVVQAMQDKKCAANKKPGPPLSDFERTITKKIKEDKRKQKAARKDVAQLSQ
jgi:flagellar hook-basal body complex protein FliE